MKRIVLMTVLTLSFAIALVSCKKDKEDEVRTYAKITVKKNGVNKAGVPVYMFSDDQGPATNFFEPFFSDRTVVTESNGVATFELREVFDLEVVDPQTTLYFGIFDGNDNALGSAALTVKKGETKSATISY